MPEQGQSARIGEIELTGHGEGEVENRRHRRLTEPILSARILNSIDLKGLWATTELAAPSSFTRSRTDQPYRPRSRVSAGAAATMSCLVTPVLYFTNAPTRSQKKLGLPYLSRMSSVYNANTVPILRTAATVQVLQPGGPLLREHRSPTIPAFHLLTVTDPGPPASRSSRIRTGSGDLGEVHRHPSFEENLHARRLYPLSGTKHWRPCAVVVLISHDDDLLDRAADRELALRPLADPPT